MASRSRQSRMELRIWLRASRNFWSAHRPFLIVRDRYVHDLIHAISPSILIVVISTGGYIYLDQKMAHEPGTKSQMYSKLLMPSKSLMTMLFYFVLPFNAVGTLRIFLREFGSTGTVKDMLLWELSGKQHVSWDLGTVSMTINKSSFVIIEGEYGYNPETTMAVDGIRFVYGQLPSKLKTHCSVHCIFDWS